MLRLDGFTFTKCFKNSCASIAPLGAFACISFDLQGLRIIDCSTFVINNDFFFWLKFSIHAFLSFLLCSTCEFGHGWMILFFLPRMLFWSQLFILFQSIASNCKLPTLIMKISKISWQYFLRYIFRGLIVRHSSWLLLGWLVCPLCQVRRIVVN